jgi:hypothetical protein
VVVSKNKIKQMETDELNNLFREWERKLDSGLQRGIRRFSLEGVSYTLKTVLFEKIKQEYQKAGWTVVRDTYGDCRESWDCIEFK